MGIHCYDGKGYQSIETESKKISPLIIYVIRRDKKYHEQGILGRYPGSFPTEEIVNIWNNTFNIPWYQFRILLNELRERNAKDLKFDAQYSLYEFPFTFFQEFPNVDISDCIIVPTDDDDWFHPDLFSILRELPKQDHYHWNYAEVVPNNYYSNIELPTYNKLTIYNKETHPKHWPYYGSNNYALSIHAPKDLDMVAYHGSANAVFSRTDENIDKCLSVHPLHLSSISFLYNPTAWVYFYDNINMRESLPDLLELFQKPIVLPDDTPEYFLPLFDELAKIYKKLSRI